MVTPWLSPWKRIFCLSRHKSLQCSISWTFQSGLLSRSMKKSSHRVPHGNWQHLRQLRWILNAINEYANITACHNTCLSHSLILTQPGCQAAIIAPVPKEYQLCCKQVRLKPSARTLPLWDLQAPTHEQCFWYKILYQETRINKYILSLFIVPGASSPLCPL